MKFELINIETWKRKEYFNHYLKTVPCSYSMTFNLDITHFLTLLKSKNIKFYPAMIYVLATTVNQHQAFRTAFDEKGNVGIFDLMHPAYTVFHPDDETFSSIWTEYNENFTEFYKRYLADIAQYSDVKQLFAKPNLPLNTFNISCLPWAAFTGFHLNLPQGNHYLLPIFTMGKYFEQEGKKLLPLSIQVHHAVCDGFHLGMFIQDLQKRLQCFESMVYFDF